MLSDTQYQATVAFGKGQKLTKMERRVLASSFGKMSRFRASVIVKNYALGELQEYGEDLQKLVHAWLVLGNRRFEVTFRVVKVCREAVLHGTLLLEKFVAEVRPFLPRRVSTSRLMWEAIEMAASLGVAVAV